MPASPEGKELSEVELALTDALKTVVEILLQGFPGSEKYLTWAFAYQRDAKLQLAQPTAAAIFELLRQFAADPQRRENREEIRKLLQEPPKGQA